MITEYPKLEKRTLVEDFIIRFEEMILSGKLSIGEKLPSERELAQKLGVSRPVVHDGLINLAEKGLVTRFSTGGAVVNDYRREGSLAFMTTLLNFREGTLDPDLTKSTLEFRRLFEVESARLAAINRTEEQITELGSKLEQEKAETDGDLIIQATLDFQLHHLIALASGNIFYPLLLNSCKPLYINFASMFYSIPGIRPDVLKFHSDLLEAIIQKRQDDAQTIMTALLEHGQNGYLSTIHS
jgi:GntR family transcriptional regulator, transcriptional repressor for pyruvate dehydrogenase complex